MFFSLREGEFEYGRVLFVANEVGATYPMNQERPTHVPTKRLQFCLKEFVCITISGFQVRILKFQWKNHP